jgi:hypothetical protein
MPIYLTENQSNSPPISISSSSSFGGGGGASFFFYYFFAACLESAAGVEAFSATGADTAGPDDAPPKLKKEVMSLPWRAFAKSLGQ